MSWTKTEIHDLLIRQKAFFQTGKTLSIPFRMEMLRKLRQAVIAHEQELTEALEKDLGRHPAEGYFCDVGTIVLEINEILHGLRCWARPEMHFSGLVCFPSLITRVYKLPYGQTLIISPFNFPFLLSLGPLAASISGGNTAIIKASSKSGHSTAVLSRIISETFPAEYIAVIDGGHDIADLCLQERFDKIFYTGSPSVARHVLQEAAKNLTPVALELGGETGNWCVVRRDADLRDAARKIAFFKLLNAGQICININQVAVAREVAEPFLELLKAEFARQIGSDALAHPEYPHLISESAYDKCAQEAEAYRDRIIYGGQGRRETLQYQPTVIYPVQADRYEDLRATLEKFQLNDASFVYEPESSLALGFGFRCGFLGLLHLEIVQERLFREFAMDVITTVPNVSYKVYTTKGECLDVHNPSGLPAPTVIDHIEEPYIRAQIITNTEFYGPVMKLCMDKRGTLLGEHYITANRVELTYEMPLSEIVFDFYDKLKSISKGYASFDYHVMGYRTARLVKLDILLNGDPADALSTLIHEDHAYDFGRKICLKLKDLIPRQQFDIAIQAAIGAKIIARETVRQVRKDVTAKCYGGDITRKRKLLEKQKEGKKRMRQIGTVQVPQSAFMAVLKLD